MNNSYLYIIIALALLSITSCGNQKLFMSSSDGDLADLQTTDSLFQHTIKPDDKLSLSIWNHDDVSLGSVFSIYNSNESYGKWVLVDQNGIAQLPKLGKVKLGGLSCTEAADTLRELYSATINSPIVVVKILNRKVTIVGEVRSPGTYILEEERVDLMEIIGEAQGFTDYADMSQVRLVRNDQSYSLDIQEMNEFHLHDLMLQADDLIIVSATTGKAIDQKAPRLIPIASSITAIAVIASFIRSK